MAIRYIILFLLSCFSLGEVFAQSSLAKRDSLPRRRRVVTQSPKDEVSAEPAKRTRSKIVNDSVKNIYGPKTTLSTTENDLFQNKKNYQPLDTAIFNLHRWDFVKKNENRFQDLGNNGTALNPIFPQMNGTIGVSPGFKVYDLYYESVQPRYYNTKSPFSRVNIIWGGSGRAMTHIEFTRNINPRWNFGFNYRPILSVKQIQSTGKNDYQVKSQYYDFYTSYESKNGKYKLLMSYRRMRHQVKESGGVLLTAIDSTYKGYFDANARPYLKAATSEELRNHVHLFHQFQLAKPIQLYQTIDVTKQVNSFHDTKTSEGNYFRFNGTDTSLVNDVNTFQVFQNEAGIKGNAAFLFYDFYYKVRAYSNTMATMQAQVPNSVGLENYIGSRIAFRFDSLSLLSGQAEYLLDGHYKIDAALRTPWLDANLHSALAKPGFMQQGYRGGYNSWGYQFSNTFSNQLSGHIKAQIGRLFISPGLTYTALHNYIYFFHNTDPLAQQAFPKQSSGNQQVVSPEVRLDVQFFKRFHLRPQVIYTTLLNNDDRALSIPTWFTNVQLSYENTIFKGALQLQVGVDVHSKSDYRALGYAPAIQQYYVQNNFISPSFWTTDFFFNGRIKRGRFFVKYLNLVQQFTGQGYLPTPFYPNVRSAIDFGFELILFD